MRGATKGRGGFQQLIAAARINTSVGAASFRWQTGGFQSVTNSVVGTTVLTLRDDYGIDATEMWPLITVDSALPAGALTSIGIVSTSDTIKTCTTWQEKAGAEGQATDVDFWIAIFKRPIR